MAGITDTGFPPLEPDKWLPSTNTSSSDAVDLTKMGFPPGIPPGGAGGMIDPKEFNKIPWETLHEKNRAKHSLTPEQSDLVKELNKVVSSLRHQLAEQEEQLRAEAWMCKACEASYPKSLVRTSIQGLMECPRCRNHDAGNIVRAGDAIRLIMKKQLDKKDGLIEAQKIDIKRLEDEVKRLTDDARRRKLRPGEPRTVEEA